MTRSARLTQKRLEGEILKLLEGEEARLFYGVDECFFCQKYGVTGDGRWVGEAFYCVENCSRCPIYIYLDGRCSSIRLIENIDSNMKSCTSRAIPGALAIYMWLFEL